MGIGPDGYYTLRDILGYNAKYNFVLSDRGRGKSYGTKLFLMRQEGQFMCLYRTEPDRDSAIGSWLDTLYEQGYSPEEFEWEKGKKGVMNLLFRGQVKGYFRCLSHVNHVKQEKFPDTLDWVWMDEFIPLVYKKLAGVQSEGDAIRAIVKTIDHDTAHPRESKGLRPVRVLLFANPFTWNNPILSYFKIRPHVGIRRVGPDIVCEMLDPFEVETSGKMTIDQFLGDEVNRNQGWEDEGTFVSDEWPKRLKPLMTIRFDKEYFAFYVREGGSRNLWVKKVNDHLAGTLLNDMAYGTIKGLREDESCIEGSVVYAGLKRSAFKGRLIFKDINCKFDLLERLA